MLRWKDYVATFARVYRSRAAELSEPEKAHFGKYVKENVLTKPCQIEVFEFSDPYWLIWIFFFDKTKPDLMISVHKEKWENPNTVVERVAAKYSKLQIDFNRLRRMLDQFLNRKHTENLAFSIDFFKNIFGLCFPADVRKVGWVITRSDSSPQEVAKMIFYLNYSQSTGIPIRTVTRDR